MQAYKYRAFELLVTLDLEIYKAVRRIIVPANLEFARLHKVLQSVFDWWNYHLYDFTIFDGIKPIVRIVPFEEDLEYDEDAILMRGHILSEFFPKYKRMIYTYDMGDNWEHQIRLIRVIENYDKESPYLLEASGQTPPEDVGGVGGFISFREIILNPDHPEYKVMKEWSRYWTPELSDWKRQPRVIRVE
ncbi:MAG: plasmid pRiA4b ORF-3 family protein [Clostridiaceae bacterium]|nr:plasmid pRiA4b ORF-3 family protein [Clostridiaceae bacterium]